jgi:hypothetical protein
MTINALIRFLDRYLAWSKTWEKPEVAFHQAFGGLTMFCELYPNEEQRAIELWNEVYKPRFEKVVYGV